MPEFSFIIVWLTVNCINRVQYFLFYFIALHECKRKLRLIFTIISYYLCDWLWPFIITSYIHKWKFLFRLITIVNFLYWKKMQSCNHHCITINTPRLQLECLMFYGMNSKFDCGLLWVSIIQRDIHTEDWGLKIETQKTTDYRGWMRGTQLSST